MARQTPFAQFVEQFGGSLRHKNLTWRKSGAEADRNPIPLTPTSPLPARFLRMDPWEADELFLVAARARTAVVELGRYYGGSAFLMAYANRQTPLYSVDLADTHDADLRAALAAHGLGQNLTLLVGESAAAWPEVPDPDLVLVDAGHKYDKVTADVRRWWPRLRPGGHMLFHDCSNGSEVQAAVLDFFDGSFPVETIRQPYNSTFYWTVPTGSLAHFRKPLVGGTKA